MMYLQRLIERIKNIGSSKASFEKLSTQETIYLYAGDVPLKAEYKKFIGLSLGQHNRNHIHHNVSNMYPLPDNCVDIYQSEDVFEHIEPSLLPDIINEIHRILKPGGIFRLSLPDYGCDLLYNRTQKNETGELQFDPGGGGDYKNGKVINGGHVWFPKYQLVKDILSRTNFKSTTFYHYYDEQGQGVTKPFDYSIAFVMRTPDNDARVQNPYRPMSIIVDCVKE